MKRLLATVATFVVLASGTSAVAAGPETILYVVNATGGPMTMTLDGGASSPPMAHMVGATHSLAPGRHVIGVTVEGSPAASETLELGEDGMAMLPSGKMAFWCVAVGRQPDATLKIIRTTPPQCGQLIGDMAKAR